MSLLSLLSLVSLVSLVSLKIGHLRVILNWNVVLGQ